MTKETQREDSYMPSDQRPTEKQQKTFVGWGLRVPKTQAAAQYVIDFIERGNPVMKGTLKERVKKWRGLQDRYEGRQVSQKGTGKIGTIRYLIPIQDGERFLAAKVSERNQIIPQLAKAVVKWEDQATARRAALGSFDIVSG